MRLQLIAKHNENQEVVTFLFRAEAELSWKPGQFMRYQIPNLAPDDRGVNRFFSIASAPFENIIQLTTKFTPNNGSTFKQNLQQLNIGDYIEAFGPSGHFTHEEQNRDLVLIAGGIGITPFRSILLDLAHQERFLKIKLIYANKNNEPVFKEELQTLAKKHSELDIHYIISDEPVIEKQITKNTHQTHGRVNEVLIRKLVPNLQESIYYISGPEPMVLNLEQTIWDLGIPKENTKRDYFVGYEQY